MTTFLSDVAALGGYYLPWRVWRRRRAQRSCPHGEGALSWVAGRDQPGMTRWCQVCHKEWR